MTIWDLNETYALIRGTFGHAQEKLARESMRSVNDRKAFLSYHFEEAMRLSKAFESKHLAGAKSILAIYVAGSEKKRIAFESYMIKAGAHSVAAVQSLHAIPDIFAHAIYFASAQNLQPHALKDPDISLPKVAACLKLDKKFAVLSTSLSTLQSGKGWGHLVAVSNMSKHRSVVRATYSEDWSGKRPKARELQITSFERKGKAYPATSLQELLEPEYKRLFQAIIGIGHDLNECLSR